MACGSPVTGVALAMLQQLSSDRTGRRFPMSGAVLLLAQARLFHPLVHDTGTLAA